MIQDARSPGPEGLAILGEFRSELGVVLWKSLRSTILWAETDPVSRSQLFDKGAADRRQVEILAAVPDDQVSLREALDDLLPLLANPLRVDAEFAGVACNRVATWAEGQGAPRTTLAFLQAAALCCPADGATALAVGRTARDLALYSQAEAWYYRAVGLSRQTGDWETYVKSYLSHGNMMLRRGALPAARRSFLKASRRSRRQGIRKLEADALHDLFVVEATAGERDRALEYARQAVETHRAERESALPRLAHDIAYFWLEQGDFRHALPVFVEALGRVSPATRPTGLGSIARAAAGVGDESAYEWSRAELIKYAPGPGIAEAWAEVARAAMHLDRLEEAQEAANLAESMARMRKEGRIRFLAESIMDEISREHEAARTSPMVERVEDPTSDRLARELIRGLQLVPSSGMVHA